MNTPYTKAADYLGKKVKVIFDRPLGSKHPTHGFIYELNYGYIPNTLSADGEELDAYYLSAKEPLTEIEGTCIACILRLDDNDDKLIVVQQGQHYTDDEITALVNFQEQWFKGKVLR